MKKLSILTHIVLPAIMSIFMAGCEELLKEEPSTFLSEEATFSTQEGAVAATLGIYAALRVQGYYGQQFPTYLIFNSDYGLGRAGFQPAGIYQLDAANIDRIGNVWTSIYSKINRANIVIQKIPEVQGMEPSLGEQLIAEARFLRALGYYNLVRCWGDVPLRLAPPVLNDLSLERAPEADVYAQIIEDLEFAETKLPDAYPSETGRVTKWAAKTLLADVYLTRERWSEAAAKAKEVIDSEQFELVRVTSSEDFQEKIFGPGIATHSEDILSIKYSVERSNDGLIRFFHKAEPGYSKGGPHAILGNLDSFIGQGEWKNEQSPDLRRNHSLYSGKDTVYLNEAVQMLFRKFRGTKTDVSNATPLLRYPEALLIFAEAESQANGGPTAAAYEALNKVHRRAYGKDPGVPAPTVDFSAGMNMEAFRDTVLMERAKEFLVESKRWFELLRTNTALEVIQALDLPITEKHIRWPQIGRATD